MSVNALILTQGAVYHSKNISEKWPNPLSPASLHHGWLKSHHWTWVSAPHLLSIFFCSLTSMPFQCPFLFYPISVSLCPLSHSLSVGVREWDPSSLSQLPRHWNVSHPWPPPTKNASHPSSPLQVLVTFRKQTEKKQMRSPNSHPSMFLRHRGMYLYLPSVLMSTILISGELL